MLLGWKIFSSIIGGVIQSVKRFRLANALSCMIGGMMLKDHVDSGVKPRYSSYAG